MKITPASIEELPGWKQRNRASERTLRTQKAEKDATDIVAAIQRSGAIKVTAEPEDLPVDRYRSNIAAALRRAGHVDILLRIVKGQNVILAWSAREEDKAIREKRRAQGHRLGTRVRVPVAAK